MSASDDRTPWEELADRGVRAVVENLSEDQAIELTEQYGANDYRPLLVNNRALIEERLLTKETRRRTYRFAPPLTIDEPFLEEIVARFTRALDASAA